MFSMNALQSALRQAFLDAGLPDIELSLERPRQREHGDWATNAALILAKPARRPPLQTAQAIVERLSEVQGVEAIEIAGPRFINFRLAQHVLTEVVRTAVTQQLDWGRSASSKASRANVEFVLVNPTGLLHVEHGWQAAVGDATVSHRARPDVNT
jgi:arginyl-tRNA synthetase